MVHKGSVAVEGISLTIADFDGETITIAILPLTYWRTNLHTLAVGAPVNVEADVLVKLAHAQLQARPEEAGAGTDRGVAGGQRVLTAAAIGTRLVAGEIMICPKCGEAMRMVEKDTSSGRDIREYECTVCGYSDWEDRGAALWQILSDDRAESQASEADRDPGSGRDVEPHC